MDYFIGYVKIDGEVVPGDVYRSKWRTEHKFVHYSTCFKIENGLVYNTDNPKQGISIDDIMYKAQLWLCSRDIQEGDKVWSDVNQEYYTADTSFIGNTTSGPETKCWYLKEKTDSEYKQFQEESLLIKVIGPISSEAPWVYTGMRVKEEDVQIIWGSKVRKTYRNGEDTDILEFNNKPDDENGTIEDRAHWWADHINMSGHGYGYTVYWNEEPPFVVRVKLRCQCSPNHFH